ncbi:hypothetical protein AVEN_67315-1 [Araneus ventricosus]|uniref:Uncharacterized protein n=1 Tax=Araneus ventricosus TaxID=182803 RepID=A0A4Y2LY12_ARAVE|nr:hypothetical protein AVEN_67315-1 [Araneus ventricosus]
MTQACQTDMERLERGIYLPWSTYFPTPPGLIRPLPRYIKRILTLEKVGEMLTPEDLSVKAEIEKSGIVIEGEAQGPNGIYNIIIQQINKRFPILFMEPFNKCLHLGTFPDLLKLGNIILFKKEGKPEDKVSSYRPISLLPTIGNVLQNKGSITTWRDLTRLATTFTDSERGAQWN